VASPGSLRSRVLTGLMLAAGLAVLAVGVTIRVNDLRVATVLSGSMRPTFSPGDLVLTQPVPTSSLRVGDVITFIPPTQPQPLIHRIASLKDGVITTKGDANSVEDPWHLTLAGSTQYRLVAVVPLLGWLTELQRPALLLAGLLVALVIVLELRKEVGKRFAKSRSQSQA
jgi:signal peptidase